MRVISGAVRQKAHSGAGAAERDAATEFDFFWAKKGPGTKERTGG